VSLWQTAVHESGHAVTATLLRATREAGPMTVQPGKSYDGICYGDRTVRPTAADRVIDQCSRMFGLIDVDRQRTRMRH
jgi:hypothetical protein